MMVIHPSSAVSSFQDLADAKHGAKVLSKWAAEKLV